MNAVMLQDLHPVLRAVGDPGDPAIRLSLGALRQSLEQLFPQELPGQQTCEASEQTARLLFKLYDREETGFVLLRSVEAALVVLSGDSLTAKHGALFQLAASSSRGLGLEDVSVSRAGLRVMLYDLSQVPAAVQESHVFGEVETAVHSCFNGVPSASVGEEHLVRWLQEEPRLLLWLSTLYRLSISKDVQHQVRCSACKGFPITGLRYRCLKCVNLHLCQTCFLTERRTRKHKPSHPVLEYCTQPSWKESMMSLASSARHTLLPRRYTTRQLETSTALNGYPRHSAPVPLCNVAPGGVDALHPHPALPPPQMKGESKALQKDEPDIKPQCPPSAPAPLCDVAPRGMDTLHPHPPLPPPQMKGESKALQTNEPDPQPQMKGKSKALQTDEPDTQPQRKMSLLQTDLSITQKAMRDLERDKWLLEREFQVWRATAQSKHDSLEDRCTDLESTMEVLVQQSQQLEDELGRVRHALSVMVREESGRDIQESGRDIQESSRDIQQPIHMATPQQDNGNNGSERQSTSKSLDSKGSSLSSSPFSSSEMEEDKREERKRETEEEDDEALHLVQEGSDMDVVMDEFVTNLQEEVLLVEDSKEVGLEEEEGPGLDRQVCITEDSRLEGFIQEDNFGPDSSDEEKEQELRDLTQRLKGALLLSTPTGYGSSQKEALLQAARGVGDSVFHMVTSLRSFTGSS
ncbi:dystrotelin isoform X2 [Electrophorus electricus]|uniref:dystrotelin isoform X2 n=1 Tax=Electrophorus electricus TaxID=8005 RepID=UPI0015CFD70C|nr:dystrotelin isoform X2 [Electrophorus electricus]XP_035376353.1 dystrotelin isoform X2 [Electrophorus electricus]